MNMPIEAMEVRPANDNVLLKNVKPSSTALDVVAKGLGIGTPVGTAAVGSVRYSEDVYLLYKENAVLLHYIQDGDGYVVLSKDSIICALHERRPSTIEGHPTPEEV